MELVSDELCIPCFAAALQLLQSCNHGWDLLLSLDKTAFTWSQETLMMMMMMMIIDHHHMIIIIIIRARVL